MCATHFACVDRFRQLCENCAATISASDGSQMQGAEDSWTCDTCTFINDNPVAKACTMYGTKKVGISVARFGIRVGKTINDVGKPHEFHTSLESDTKETTLDSN